MSMEATALIFKKPLPLPLDRGYSEEAKTNDKGISEACSSYKEEMLATVIMSTFKKPKPVYARVVGKLLEVAF